MQDFMHCSLLHLQKKGVCYRKVKSLRLATLTAVTDTVAAAIVTVVASKTDPSNKAVIAAMAEAIVTAVAGIIAVVSVILSVIVC